ncbi:hypothetical protein QWY20_17400 [Alkalimonas sp. MEB108]|uniref:Tyr recombinase domain-containing protein n=1 Tax=Alkalimonas cellulosilytica TaxID=3058395 RepID=A0ABU7J9M0_9GAMM|nr:hypothetical protein [Alkalimonas sp. MEB108]MEE2003234.1 hypothetical protein [Alkalimonas sp. MEB108]
MNPEISHFFDIPEDFPFGLAVSRLRRGIFYLIQISTCSGSELDHMKQMHSVLQGIQTPPQQARERNDLYNYLKNNPFLATLLQIGEPHSSPYVDDTNNRTICLLMHVFDCRGAADYPAYLAFRKTVIESSLELHTLPALLDLTSLEIQVRMRRADNRHPELKRLHPFLTPLVTRNQRECRGRMDNQHRELIDNNETTTSMYALQLTDENAETSNEIIGCDSKILLTTEQQRRQFQRRLNGAQRAYYAHESAVIAGIHTALPEEFRVFLQQAAPFLLTGEMSKIPPETSYSLLILFLALFGISEPENLTLINKRSQITIGMDSLGACLVYELRLDARFLTAKLELPANLIKTASPQTRDPRIHHTAEERLSLTVPYPATYLLNALIRVTPPKRRHLNRLSELGSFDYRAWLNDCLRRSGLHIKGLTKKALERSFQQFAREQVPETYFRFLSGQPCVQSHYVSVAISTLSETITAAWRRFCVQVGIHWKNANVFESGERVVIHPYHTEVGSKRALRPEIYNAIFHRLVNDFGVRTDDCLNQIAFYLYLRVASTVGLRPTKIPFPTVDNMHWELGIFTVADKRVRSKNELRLIILPLNLVELISLWRRCAQDFSISKNVAEPSHLLMSWDESWVHFDRALANKKLAELTNDNIVNHSLRHTAAQRYIQGVPEFKQPLLDMLLNHSRAGVSVFHRYAQASPRELIRLQQSLLERVDDEFASFDAAIHKRLTQLVGAKNAVS